MKKRIGLLAALLLTGASVQAAMQTDVQEVTITKSGPFSFEKFNPGLGALTGVFFRYQVASTQGAVTFDNRVNNPLTLYAKAEAVFGMYSRDNVDFIDENGALLTPGGGDYKSSSEWETLNLAADPTESVGGDGPDVATLSIPEHSFDSGFNAVGQDYLEDFMGLGSFRFNAYSSVGVQGGSLDARLLTDDAPVHTGTMSMYYTYDSATSDVSSPMALGLLGLALLGAGAHRRRE